MPDADLAAALTTFERVEVNLSRLEAIWRELSAMIPPGTIWAADGARYDELARSFEDLAQGLPAIAGYRVTARPLTPDETILSRVDALDVGEASVHVDVERAIYAPGDEIAEYKHRLRRERRQLVRRRADELVVRIESLLPRLAARHPRSGESVAHDPEWQAVEAAWREILRLIGDRSLSGTRAGDLSRHIRFALAGDLHDIVDHDWPSVRPAIERSLYEETEPLPVDVEDLAAVVASRPAGEVPTRLDFSRLDDEDFERLIFTLLTTTPGYENASWLMETRAPDRGRDLAVEQVSTDPLIGTRRLRIIVQCKNWKRSLSPKECQAAIAPIPLWEPPKVDLLVLATTGRFSEQGVQWIEQHNHVGRDPRIAMWPNSHLELLLAGRGDLVEEFHLRPPAD
jgi:Restriction endonuclease